MTSAHTAGQHGLLVIDKPAGMTSHDVVARVRRHMRTETSDGSGAEPARKRSRRGKLKVGHAGTLDPDATGVLLVCVGKATRLADYLHGSAKTYEARMRLGAATTTLDAAGDVTDWTDASAVSETALCDALQSQVGTIAQAPPMVSAVKVDGERLHQKARRGEEVAREPRTVTVHELVLEDFLPGAAAEATFLVTCSSGTYVRVLAADVGDQLEVGAHLQGLRRLGSGPFSLEESMSLETLDELGRSGELTSALHPMAAALADYPARELDDADVRAVSVGRAVAPSGVDGPVGALDGAGNLVAVLTDEGEAARPRAVFAPAGEADGSAAGQHR